jgi:3-hydroxyacyl-CoA dehydrogenase
VALIGAGVMGGGVAELASRHGIQVRMRDLSVEALDARCAPCARSSRSAAVAVACRPASVMRSSRACCRRWT